MREERRQNVWRISLRWSDVQIKIIEDHGQNITDPPLNYLIFVISGLPRMGEPNTDMDKVLLGNTRELKEVKVVKRSLDSNP